jgi:HTH-type transcriptional regulator / antitoxin HigA
MTLTFNPVKYSELLTEHQPKLIKTEAENDHALAVIESLMNRPSRSPEESELYELLIVLVERFEQDYYHLEDSTTNPQSLLLFLMEQHNLVNADLVPIFGTEEKVVNAINNECELNRVQIKILAELFHVSPIIFI